MGDRGKSRLCNVLTLKVEFACDLLESWIGKNVGNCRGQCKTGFLMCIRR